MSRGRENLTPENCPKHELVSRSKHEFHCRCGYWQFRDGDGNIITQYKFREKETTEKKIPKIDWHSDVFPKKPDHFDR